MDPTLDNVNPYATPSTSDLGNPPAEPFWYCDPTAVFVRDGAELPKVDLETGRNDDTLIRSERRHERSHWSKGMLGWFPAIFLLASIKWEGSNIILAGILAAVFCIWPWLIFRGARKPLVIHVFSERASEVRFRRIRFLQRFIEAFQVILTTCCFAVMIFPEMLDLDFSDKLLNYFVIPCMALMFVMVLLHNIHRPRVDLTDNAPKGWARIENINHFAMIKLRKLERDGANHV